MDTPAFTRDQNKAIEFFDSGAIGGEVKYLMDYTRIYIRSGHRAVVFKKKEKRTETTKDQGSSPLLTSITALFREHSFSPLGLSYH